MSKLSTRLILFLLFSAIVVNLPTILVRETLDAGLTSLDYTVRLWPTNAWHDSWQPMRMGIDFHRDHPNQPLYSSLIFDHGIKFIYPPTSFLFSAFLQELSLDHDMVLNSLSLLALVGTALMVGWILAISLKDVFPEPEQWLLFSCGVIASLTFYPLIRGYAIGQIQTLLTFFYTASLMLWIKEKRVLPGIFCGIICLFKPHLLLFLLWGLFRKEWRFAFALAGTVFVGAITSIALYGWENHVDYATTLLQIANQGEAFHPNQSANGLLNRFFFNGSNLVWDVEHYAPPHPMVQLGTTISSIILILLAFFRYPAKMKNAPAIDFALAGICFTMASPVAWEHHYGILLPLYALLFAMLVASPSHNRRTWRFILLGASYLLSSNLYPWTNAFANSRMNIVQSYLYFGALIALGIGYFFIPSPEENVSTHSFQEHAPPA